MDVTSEEAGNLVFLNIRHTTDDSNTNIPSSKFDELKFLSHLPPVGIGELKLTLDVDEIQFNEQDTNQTNVGNENCDYQLKCKNPESVTSKLHDNTDDTTINSHETIVEDSSDGKNTYACTQCPRFKASSIEKALQHQRRHRGENPFQCNVCEYSTYNTTRMQEHTDMHKGNRPYKCTKCSYSSSSKKNTKKHELKHQRKNLNDCSLCEFYGKNRAEINEHMATVHKRRKGQPHCEHRLFESEDPVEMAKHKKMHNIECSKCGEVWSNRSTFSKHIPKCRRKAKPKGAYDFTCEVCKWSSISKPKILLHLIHHPLQTVDETKLDISVLRKYGIMK